jgi:hypothetical protein
MYWSIDEFYDADPRLRHSDEADCGSNWRLYPSHELWRISYVRDTGEVHAVRQSGRAAGPVLMLGTVLADEVTSERQGLYYRTLDCILEGWSERCTGRDGLW